MTAIIKILLEEALGFHAEVQEVKASYGASPIWALAGCLDFDAKTLAEKSCGEQETRYHISVDSWIGSYLGEYDSMRNAHPTTVPVDLGAAKTPLKNHGFAQNLRGLGWESAGSMGYDGEESMYLREETLLKGYNEIGLALDFYKSYNTTHHKPQKYFDSIEQIPKSELSFCNESDMANAQRMGFYQEFAGDPDGVVDIDGNGTFWAYCPDDHWWLSPACRHDATTCIPCLTASVGWRLQAMMQWATAYGMPVAIGVIQSWSTYVNRVRQTRVLFYWWVPDSSFIEMRPVQIIFPGHSFSAWARGDKKTGGAGTLVSKVVSSNLVSKATAVHNLVSKIHFEIDEVQDLLLDMTTKSPEEVACQWVKSHQDVWERWLPVESNCLKGFGMINGDKEFMENRTGAVGCGLCPAGRFSDETADLYGTSHRCAPCPPGFSQSETFSTSCQECPKGTYSNEPGSEMCTLCPFGQYQNLTAQSSCKPCGPYKTTLYPASLSSDQCVCEGGRIEDQNRSSKGCVLCMEGLQCPRGSTVAKLLLSNGTAEESQLRAGFNSDPTEPLAVFKCPSDSMCPGGKPGNCPGTLSGRTCAECGEDRYRSGHQCLNCDPSVKIAWICVGLLFCCVLVSTHVVATNKYTTKATSVLCITSGFGMLVILFQNLGVLQTISVSWPDGLNDFLRFASLFLFRLEGFGLSCFTGDVVWEYAAITAIFWFLLVSLPVMALLTNCIPCFVRRGWAWNVFKSFSTVGQFLQVGFTTMTSLSMTPFMCYKHPNGQESILKYPDIFCGSAQHTTMRVFGTFLVTLAGTFLVLCCYSALRAPQWSNTAKLAAVRFLVVRFRPDVWWFGLVLLFRGLLLSVPAVIVTDMPSIHLALMLIVLLLGLCLQTFFLPWKAPVLNLVDALSNGCFVALLSVALAFLEVDSDEAKGILQSIAIFFSVCMVAILVFMIFLSLLGLIYTKAMGNAEDSWIYNLGKAPRAEEVFKILMDIAQYMQEEAEQKETDLVSNLENFSVYDLDAVLRAMNILADDLEMTMNIEKTHGARINSGQRSIRPTEFNPGRATEFNPGRATEFYLQRLSKARQSRTSALSRRSQALRETAYERRTTRLTMSQVADADPQDEDSDDNENQSEAPPLCEAVPVEVVQKVEEEGELVHVEVGHKWEL